MELKEALEGCEGGGMEASSTASCRGSTGAEDGGRRVGGGIESDSEEGRELERVEGEGSERGGLPVVGREAPRSLTPGIRRGA